MFLVGAGPDSTPAATETRVPLILGVQSTLIVICLAIWALRIDTRWRLLNQLWWDDLFISLGMFFALMSFVVETMAVAYGSGVHYNTLSKQQLINYRKAKLAAQPIWSWEMCFIKLSVAAMFLRFTRVVTWKRTWKVLIWISIFIIIGSSITTTVFQLTPCRPFARNWDVSIQGVCRNPVIVKRDVIATSAIYAITDFEFALLPLTFLLTLHRPARDKIAVAGIMGLGFLAAIIGVVKFISFNSLFTSRDITWNAVPLGLGSLVEVNLALIAANIPPLKSRSERFFKSVGGTIQSVRGARRSRSLGATYAMEPPTPQFAPNGHHDSGTLSTDEFSPIDSFSKEPGMSYKQRHLDDMV